MRHQGFCFSDPARCRRSRAITAILTALCLRPSARPPPPIDVLLKAKVKPQFERTVERLSKPFFVFFSLPIEVNFQPFFSFPLSGRQRVATPALWLSAEC